MKRLRSVMKTVLLLCIFLLALVFAECFNAGAQQKPSLAILPFFLERVENPARGAVVCPLCKGLYRYGEVTPGSPEVMTRLLYTKLEQLGRFLVLRSDRVEALLTPPVRAEFDQKPVASAVRIGRELDSDFVLVAYLFRFEERVGSSVGVDRAASVGFDLHLVRVRDGVPVWRGTFDETQQPLSENLLKMGSFMRRKASWVTAQELASVGMDEMLKQFPGMEELERKVAP